MCSPDLPDQAANDRDCGRVPTITPCDAGEIRSRLSVEVESD